MFSLRHATSKFRNSPPAGPNKRYVHRERLDARAERFTTKTSAMLKMLALAVPMFLLLLHGQSDDGSKFTVKLLHNRYGLSVRNGELSGTGAPVLQSAIARSRFVLLGEEHGIAETPKFWIGVCNAAGPAGFQPWSSKKGLGPVSPTARRN